MRTAGPHPPFASRSLVERPLFRARLRVSTRALAEKADAHPIRTEDRHLRFRTDDAQLAVAALDVLARVARFRRLQLRACRGRRRGCVLDVTPALDDAGRIVDDALRFD